jgi:hypothetical protein
MPIISRDALKQVAASKPDAKEYLARVYAGRDPKKDTDSHIFLPAAEYAALAQIYGGGRIQSTPISGVPMFPRGLGTLVRNGVDAASLGLAKPIADALAKAFAGGNCQCLAREACLNKLVPDVHEVLTREWPMIAVKAAFCVVAKSL